MREINEIRYNREKNDMGDYVIDGRLTIEELYFLAKKEGFEKRSLYFKLKEVNNNMSDTIYCDHVMSFGKGWSKDTSLMEIKYKKEDDVDLCSG